MKKIAYWFSLLMLILSIGLFSSCKTDYAARKAQRETDNQRKARIKQSQREYDKAYKAHLNKQEKGTKKRLKKHNRDQEKHYRNKHSKR